MIEPATKLDIKAIERLLRMAFGFGTDRSAEYVSNVGLQSLFVLRDGPGLAACAALLETRHRFGGGWVPAANIAHVAIAPEARGRGLAAPFVDALCRQAASRRAAMVTLFASARPVYRKSGFELAGSEIIYEAETAALPTRTDLVFRRLDADDPRLHEAYHARTIFEAGLLDRSPKHWNELLRAPRHALEAFGVGDQTLSAYVIVDASEESYLTVRDWYAPTGEAASGVLCFLGRFRSVFSKVRWHGGPHDDLVSAMPDKGWRLAHQEEWLARILDPEAALEARRYAVRDAVLGLSFTDANKRASNLVLEISGGRPRVRREPALAVPALTLSAATFASLFTGFRSASRMARQGLIEADVEGMHIGDLVFSGPPPWLAEHV